MNAEAVWTAGKSVQFSYRKEVIMELSEIFVTLSGLGLSLFVLWFFFFSKKERYVVSQADEGTQHVAITVKGGYDPDVIVVRSGKPVKMDFYRDETSDCSEQVLLPAFKTSAFLEPFKTTSISFTPEKQGEFDFTCGMGMLRGKIIVE